MPLSERAILQALMKWRTRLSAAAWVIVRDAHAAEDIFQNVTLKAMTRDVCFEAEGALLSWAFITARREAIDWLRRLRREANCLPPELLDLLEHDWMSRSHQPAGSVVDALRDCLESASEDSRRLLRLRYFESRRCDDVAEQMGLGLDAIYKRLSRLHDGLRKCIEEKLGPVRNPGGLVP